MKRSEAIKTIQERLEELLSEDTINFELVSALLLDTLEHNIGMLPPKPFSDKTLTTSYRWESENED